MEKKELQEYSALLDEVAELIVKLAGNLQRAEGVIRGTDKEREYNQGGVYWAADDALNILHRLQTMKVGIENELDRIYYQGRKD